MAPLKGKDAIRQYVAAGFQAPGFRLTWKAQEVVVNPGGMMAYEIADNEFTIADSTGALHTSVGKAVAVWRKDPDGVWRCVVDIWNSQPPVAD
jgi:ketosteroid isomerase-like protein